MAVNALANLMTIENPTFNLPVLADPQSVIEVMQVNLEGTEPKFDRVKIPSGGGLAFELPGDGDQPEIVQEIVGVILDHYPVNAFWKDRYTGSKNPPDCSALDAHTGVGDPGGNCTTCPYNQWGSAVDEHGQPTRGKACKNIHRVYILREGEVFPLLVALPPTSKDNFTDYMKRLTSRKPVPYFGCVTKIRLQKVTNAGGIMYSQAVLSKVADLRPEEVMAMRAYANSLKSSMRAVKIEAAEYAVDVEGGTVTEQGGKATATDGREPF